MNAPIDLRRILELTDILYETAEAPSLWGSFLEGLAGALGARGFSLSQVAPGRPDQRLITHDHPMDMSDELSGWFETLATSGFEPLAVFKQSRSLGAVLGQQNGMLTIVGLVRRPEDPPFRAEAGEVFTLLLPLMARALRFQRFLAAKTSHIDLPPRQREVLTLGAQGLRSKEIAQRLGLSARTVEHHFSGAAKRLKARGRSQAIATALDLGLIEPDGGARSPRTGKK
jgi:DNA-binding CsgD family transcriptional regulator